VETEGQDNQAFHPAFIVETSFRDPWARDKSRQRSRKRARPETPSPYCANLSAPIFETCKHAHKEIEMLNLKKSLKLAGVLAIVLGAAAPVMTTAASAAPAGHYDVQRDHRDFRGDRHEHRYEHGRWHRHHEFRFWR
jgi:hypothetical protein